MEDTTLQTLTKLPVLSVSSTTNQEPQKFTSIIKSLKKFYPEKKFEDISVQFCFICLLHLANEQNLEITKTSPNYFLKNGDKDDGMEDLIIRQKQLSV